jgi:hypothetical protein
VAASRLKRPTRQFPSLSSRLRVAIAIRHSRNSSFPAEISRSATPLK